MTETGATIITLLIQMDAFILIVHDRIQNLFKICLTFLYQKIYSNSDGGLGVLLNKSPRQ
jgi:hypothetical protein